MRFDATTRRPASSSILVTAPVRLRRVASGLMIEKVRVTAMLMFLKVRKLRLGDCGAPLAPKGAHCKRMLAASAPAARLVLLVDLARDAFLAIQRTPHFARRRSITGTEHQQRPLEAQCLGPP